MIASGGYLAVKIYECIEWEKERKRQWAKRAPWMDMPFATGMLLYEGVKLPDNWFVPYGEQTKQ